MKLHWGNKIAIALALFIVFIVAMSVVMMNSSQALYEDDYYEVGENHAARMEAEESSENVEIVISEGTNKLYANFNTRGKINKIKLIYLANDHFDRTINVRIAQEVESQSVPLGNMKSGLWNIEVFGLVNGERFFSKLKVYK